MFFIVKGFVVLTIYSVVQVGLEDSVVKINKWLTNICVKKPKMANIY